MIDASVIVPTRNRRSSLLRTLHALAGQDLPAGSFEAIVAVDGSSDDTMTALRGARFSFPLHVVGFDAPRGAAAARNLGARAARGDVLLFIDDDVEPSADLLAAHIAAHRDGAQVTTGYLRTVGPNRTDFFQIALRGWWEAMFASMRRVGHRYDFRDVLTGNCAIDRQLFNTVGGFDERLRCHEDYEFGVRALATSAELHFVPQAAAIHHECTTLARSLLRKRDEGVADVHMIRRHPHLVTVMPLGIFEQYATPTQSLFRRLAFDAPAAGRSLARVFVRALRFLEAARLRGRWQHRLYDLLHHSYWSGIAEAVGTFEDFQRLRQDCRAHPGWQPLSLDVDLSAGLPAAMRLVDVQRPDAVNVLYGPETVGTIPAMPGAERLKGTHLRASLARELGIRLLSALARSDVLALETHGHAVAATGPIPVRSLAL